LVKYGIAMLYPKSSFQHSKEDFDFRYTIINKKFLNYRKRSVNSKIKNVLVIQGGADTYCFIPKIINILKKNQENYNYHIVLGPSFKCWDKLKTSCNNVKNFKILKNVKDMGKLMNDMDIAISAAGMTGLELACIGIPTIFITAEKFELETSKLLEKQGFGKNLGFGGSFEKSKLNRILNSMNVEFDKRQKMNKVGKRIINGKGTENLIKLIDSL
jgi:Spore coat polysaccharide biosynthesis protein, predicted glycosyltransferase